ncbi:MAG: hypothetical protein ACOY45_08435 [Pseudomonadota bacterium]
MARPRLIRWNDQLVEIAQVIGEAAVVQLCEALGGTRTYVPRLIPANHPIALAIGGRAAAALADHYYGTYLDLPKAHNRRARAVELATSGGLTQKQAALAADYSERHLRRLLRAAEGDEDQPLLPF